MIYISIYLNLLLDTVV